MDMVAPMSTHHIIIDSPIGELLVTASDDALTGLEMAPFERPAEPSRARANDVLKAARTQLNAYFRGKQMSFDLPLAPAGTPFQQGVWQELTRIPLGRDDLLRPARRASRAPGALPGGRDRPTAATRSR